MFTILCSISVRAQSSPDGPGPEELIQRLQKRIDQLEASQKVMQEKIDHIGSAPPAAQAPEAPATPATETVETQPEAPLAHVLGPVQLHGFSDIDYGGAWFEKLPPGGLKGSTNSINVGDFDLHTNTQLSDSWSMLGEMLVSSDFSNEFSVEMDRLQLTYKKNDYFKISFGKFATALGYYTQPVSSRAIFPDRHWPPHHVRR
jgi:phosphate-selective porin